MPGNTRTCPHGINVAAGAICDDCMLDLQADLDELERTDPDVGAAVEAFEELKGELIGSTTMHVHPDSPLSLEEVMRTLADVRPPNPAEVAEAIHVCEALWDTLCALAQRGPHPEPTGFAFVHTGIAVGIDDSIPPDCFDIEYQDGHRERRSLRGGGDGG